MKNIKLIIEYNGKEFNGWQKQPNKLNIQGEIERAIEEITRRRNRIDSFRKNGCRCACNSTSCKF